MANKPTRKGAYEIRTANIALVLWKPKGKGGK